MLARRQRITFIENLKSWAIGKGSNNNFIRLTENRYEWRNMIANVCSRQAAAAAAAAAAHRHQHQHHQQQQQQQRKQQQQQQQQQQQ
ncbi:Rab3 GTPase-activating protein catalytic subunit [Plakobranchus ocellatus]|uniref:Rab3 GTPase-activating protein catalytic subunit n=1 Tax=Plakobranchus ocellatus TaxID=259542 RepID=A0AAV3XTS2_9GAST|nr:Rab3 GTPase-activating protein catalytic subunit [Plakobranchus ocellatus]